MKKVIFCFAMLSMVFATTSCGGDDDDDEKSCETLLTEYTAAFEFFFDNLESEDACNDFTAAAQAYLDAECISGQQATAIQTQIDLADCSEL